MAFETARCMERCAPTAECRCMKREKNVMELNGTGISEDIYGYVSLTDM